MKCPKCGSRNSDTNRFCRGCGCRLEGLADRDIQGAPDVAVVDEVALGEQLFEVWQLYSAGDIKAALAKIDDISRAFPERPSVHSLYALIHEREAETEIEAGNVEAARSLLLQALDRYEKIVGLNPNSAADREKLATLRKKLGVTKSKATSRRGAEIMAALKSLPPPVLVAGAVFLLALVVAGFMWAPGPDDKPRHTSKVVHVTPPQPSAGEANASVSSAPPLRIYTFPSQVAAPAQPTPQPPADAGESTPPTQPPSVQPLKVPSLPDVKIAPEKPKPANKPKQTVPEATAPSDDSDNDRTPDGATMLARSIKLHEQGLTQRAIIMARQAITLFDAEAAAGKNSVTAKRGAENARKLIAIWQADADETEQ